MVRSSAAAIGGSKELCQRKRRAHLLPFGAAAALAAASTAVEADVLSEMQRFWDGAAVNTTGPTRVRGPGVRATGRSATCI